MRVMMIVMLLAGAVAAAPEKQPTTYRSLAAIVRAVPSKALPPAGGALTSVQVAIFTDAVSEVAVGNRISMKGEFIEVSTREANGETHYTMRFNCREEDGKHVKVGQFGLRGGFVRTVIVGITAEEVAKLKVGKSYTVTGDISSCNTKLDGRTRDDLRRLYIDLEITSASIK